MLTIYGSKIEKMSVLSETAVRELERAVVLKTPNSVALNDIGLHLSVSESRLEICNLKRGVAIYSSIYANKLDNVVKTIKGKRYNLRRYVIVGEEKPFCKVVSQAQAASDEEVLDERVVKRLYASFKKVRDDKKERNGNGKRGQSDRGRGAVRGRRGGITRSSARRNGEQSKSEESWNTGSDADDEKQEAPQAPEAKREIV